MPFTTSDIDQLPNLLEAWITSFEEVGVSAHLLQEAFADHPPRSFAEIYNVCSRWRRVELGSLSSYHFAAPWQLVALTGEKDRLNSILEKHNPQDLTDNLGAGFLHYIATSGSVPALQFVLERSPYLADSKNNAGWNLLHFAALSGSVPALQFVLERSPHLADSKNNASWNLLHFAALSGSVPALQFVLERSPYLADSKSNSGTNLLHYAALSGSVPALQFVLERSPYLADSKSNSGTNLLHYAALSGSVPALQFVLERSPYLADSKSNSSTNLLHYAALSGLVPALQFVLARSPHLADSKDNAGNNLLHYAATSGSVPALQFVLARSPHLADSKNNAGWNLLHFVASSGSVPVLQFVLKEFPKLAAQLWVKNKEDDTPDSLALRSKMKPTPRQILQQMLKRATLECLTSTALDKPFELIEAFQEEWRYLLHSDDGITLSQADVLVLLQEKRSPQICHKMLVRLQPTLELKALHTEDEILHLDLLRQLVHRAGAVLNRSKTFSLTFSPQSEFLNRLIVFTKKAITKEKPGSTLSEEAMITLSVIVDDYQRAAIQKDTQALDKILITKLFATATMKKLRPQPSLSRGRDIGPHNVRDHFVFMKDTFTGLAVSNEIQRIINDTVLPGFQHLLENEDKIVEHMMSQFGVLYYLDAHEKLPMHTDHVDCSDPVAYRALLHRLLQNVFGAFYLCLEAGKAAEFFDQLTQGYCLEGRVRALLSWAAQFSEIKIFNAFMGERIKEYLAYRGYLFDETPAVAGQIQPACDFIITRFKDFPCKPDPKFAPNGEVTRAGIVAYLDDVLAYDQQKSSCVIS